MNPVYAQTGSLIPNRSVFDLSYTKIMTCDMGNLYPVACDEVVPGDVFNIGHQAIVRFLPLVAPVLHEINLYAHTFFVPYRILWNDSDPDNWTTFITGGKDGTAAPTLPLWDPTDTTEGSLWDYLGFPTGIIPDGVLPVDFPRRAYNLIYNEYYRDETLVDEVDLDNETILVRAWEKDYFTSSLPFMQRGVAPALPITGILPVKGIGKINQNFPVSNQTVYESGETTSTTFVNSAGIQVANPDFNFNIEGSAATGGFPTITVDLAGASTFNVNDLRLAFQTQKWLERNARAGVRVFPPPKMVGGGDVLTIH